jgi:hypothetical protein
MALAHEWSERRQERRVWEFGVALLDAFPTQNGRSIKSALELEYEPRLTDPRVAAEQHQYGLPGDRFTPRQLEFR